MKETKTFLQELPHLWHTREFMAKEISMALSVEASFTRTEKFLRAVVFLKEGKENTDAPISVLFSGTKEYIFIPAPKEKKTDPVYPEESGGQFVHRIEKGIYHATLFGKKRELNKVKKARIFVGGKETIFDVNA